MGNHGLITRKEGWLAAWVGPELVMMNGADGTYVSVNETGGRIWELLARPQTPRDLCDSLAAEYGSSPDAIDPEVTAFLGQMLAHGALHADPPVPA